MIKTPLSALVFSALGALLFVPGITLQAHAQEQELEFPKASPPASVQEQVGVTTVEIDYARPSLKGRKAFGALVPYGEVWRTGANQATRISFSTDITLAGEDVSAGSYALFTIPGERQWVVILNKVPEQWGSYGYDVEQDVLRVTVDAETLSEPVETMRLSIDQIHQGAAQLTMSWERTRVRVPIDTDLVARMVPMIEAAMSAPGEDKPYFAAAMFYYENDVDLFKALVWIEKELSQQPNEVWVQYRQGLMLAKIGDKQGAREAANKALAQANAAGGELGAEYRRLSETLLASLK
jgi:hypothetical protein